MRVVLVQGILQQVGVIELAALEIDADIEHVGDGHMVGRRQTRRRSFPSHQPRVSAGAAAAGVPAVGAADDGAEASVEAPAKRGRCGRGTDHRVCAVGAASGARVTGRRSAAVGGGLG